MSDQSKNPVKAVIALMICTLGWTFAPIFIRLLKDDYTPLTQGLVRYVFGSTFLIGLCLVYHRQALLTLLRNPLPVLGISALNTFNQYTWTAGTYGTGATMAQLVVKINIVFVVIFAFILFHEERAVIRSPVYLLGTALSMVGVTGVMIRDASTLFLLFDSGNMLLAVTAVLWAVYAVWGKHIVLGIHPIPMFAVVSALTAVGLFFAALVFENPTDALGVGLGTTFIAALSGVIAIGGAHPAFHYAQRHFGSAFTNTFMLILPLTTYGAARILLPEESLTTTQWAGAGVLLLGTLLIIVVENRRRSSADAPAIPVETAPSTATERAL